ncbi:MAG: MFS transporter [Clostridiales bacterium]|nr:MFS transporter [Clostridiales bacterium]MCF8022220.1 MFS transporter [Clostridiales bacterium]
MKAKESQKQGLYYNLILIFLSAFFVFVNFYTSLTVVPLYVLHLGGNVFFAGLQGAVFYIAGIILRIYFGPLADKKGRKLPLLIGAFVFATSSLMFAAVSNCWLLILIRVYQGIALAAFLSSASSLVADIVPPEKTGIYLGLYRLILSLSLLIGPAAAQVIIDYYSFDSWFLISFFTGLISFILIMFIKTVPCSYSGFSMYKNMSLAIKDKKLWLAYWGVFLISTGYGGILNFVTIYISQSMEAVNPGIYFTYFALAGIAGNLAAGYLSDRLGRNVVVWPLVMLLALGSIVLYFLPYGSPVLIISSSLAGIGFSGGISALIAWLVDKSRENIRATVLSIEESAIDLGIALGAFLIGTASGITGLPFSFLFMGLIVFMTALYLFVYTSKKTQET